jgi:Rrf2 family nitric oxide-sensitive transcriptional repressor
MRFSLHTDYALRVLMYLGTHDRRATVAEVADFFRISQTHVAKVVHQLGRLGFIRNVRGIGGGIELGRAPKEISLGEVVVAFEGNLHLLECVGRSGVCVIESFCKLRQVLAHASQIQLDYLNSLTLLDVLPNRMQLGHGAPASHA